ncbi:hypothetical protein Tco_0082142, partial [Tanacetum coccineum]
MENYKNVSQDIRDQLNAKAEVVQIILTCLVKHSYNPLALVAQQQPVYHHQNHPTQNTQYSSNRLQQSTRNRGKAIVTSSAPTYDQEPATVTKDDEMSKEKEIDKLMALISLLFKKIYNLPTTTFELHQTPVELIKIILQESKEELEQADWKDDTDDESDDQELEAHYMYMAQIQEVTPDVVDISRPVFDVEPLQKVQNNDDNYNVFDDDREYPEQPESVKEPYPDMCYDREHDDQDDTNELAQERDLLASLIEKLKCEIDD